MQVPGLVNFHITDGKITIEIVGFNGKITIFNGKITIYSGITMENHNF